MGDVAFYLMAVEVRSQIAATTPSLVPQAFASPTADGPMVEPQARRHQVET
jgi:hypothetical protein